MNWKAPEGGAFYIAVLSMDCEVTVKEVEGFFSRRLARYSYRLVHETKTYVVFNFKEKQDADRCMNEFQGEPFDPRDKGGGVHWGRWYKGRAARRASNRSPYDFS